MALADHYLGFGKKMESKKHIHRSQDGIALACGGCIILLIVLIMNKNYPFVGSDYRYFIPRLIDTSLHMRINGPVIQWYTPSFGGGLPAFANPQNIEYSIVQWLSYCMNPWSAILLSTAVISIIGYYFFYKLLSQKLDLHWIASILGAMFFIGNGFYIEHLIVGHLGYQLFPLGSAALYALIDTRNKFHINVSVIAIVITLFIHQAGFYLLIILILSIGMTLPVLFLYKPAIFNLRNIALITTTSAILSIAMALSKVYAVYTLMRHFSREIFDSYNTGLLQALAGLTTQLLGVMVLGPIVMLTGQNPELLSGAFSSITASKYGIWEIDTGLSPVLVIVLFLGLARSIKSIRASVKPKLTRSQLICSSILILTVWVTAEMTIAKGMIYTVTKQFPVLKSLHVNVRFAAAFILPLTLTGTFELHRYFFKNPKSFYFAVSVLTTFLSLLTFFCFSEVVHNRDFSVRSSNVLHYEIQSGREFQVLEIIDKSSGEGFSAHSSSYRPYEPVFGYSLESFTPEISPGSVFKTSDGYFNMTNPVSLVFPEINNLHLFERFKVSERDKLEIFLARGQPEWNMPRTQKVLNVLSLITLIFTVGILCLHSALRVKAAIKHEG